MITKEKFCEVFGSDNTLLYDLISNHWSMVDMYEQLMDKYKGNEYVEELVEYNRQSIVTLIGLLTNGEV